MKNKTSRREFIRQIMLSGALLGISPYLLSCIGCSEDEVEAINLPNLPLMQSAEAPFGIWRQMIQTLEKSPDHLLGRRKALIAAKNPEKMIEFVRDNIQIRATTKNFLSDGYRDKLYGPDIALRSGIATLREKAEILRDMLLEAGFEAKIIVENIDFTEEELKNIFFRSYRPPFKPPISEEQMQAWKQSLGADDNNGSLKEINLSGNNIDEITHQIMEGLVDFNYNYLENSLKPPENGKIPSVIYKENNEEKFAHIFDPSVPTGSFHPKNTENKFNNSGEVNIPKREIKISLSYRSTTETKKDIELLSGTWKIEDLLGSTVSLEFLNNMDFKAQATKRIADINSFTPCFSFQKIGTEKELMESLSVLGEPIDLNANEILPKEDGLDLITSNVQGDTTRVTQLTVNAIPMVFPEVRLEIFPTDENGNIVENLSASNFVVQDNENQISARMKQNVISPKIMVLHDNSGSMPLAYRNKEEIEQFKTDLEKVIREIYPHAKVQTRPTGSDIYTSLLRAKQSDSDMILYATDGDNNDEFDPNYLEVYNSGKPMVILEVREKSKTYDDLKDNIENLISIPAVDKEAVKEEIRSLLSDLKFPPYVMTYNSFNENEEHELKLKLSDKDLFDETKFMFAKKNDMYMGERMVGLYLTIKGYNVNLRRTLAGWDNTLVNYEHSRKYIDEVHEMLLGGAVIAFESEAPNLSIRLTEYLTTLLSHENWFNAQREGDYEKAVTHLQEGTLNYPPLLLSMMQPLSNPYSSESITLPSGFRSCIIKLKPGLYSPNSNVSFDYLPTSKYQTISTAGDGKTNLEETIKKTMQFALLESEMFQDSTLTQLKNKKLISTDKAKKDIRFENRKLRELNPVFQRRIFQEGNHVFFDESLTASAYFKVDRYSGELYANLPDGTGGGGDSIQRQLEELKKVVAEYEQLVSGMNVGMAVGGVGTFSLGVVANYSVTLVKLYAFASEAIILMNASDLDDQIKIALAELACNVYKDIAYLSLGPVGDGISFFENLIGAMGGNFPFNPCSL